MFKKIIHVIAVSYKRYGELRVFVQSWLNQTENNWRMTVIHDGKDLQFEIIMKSYQSISNNRIDFYCTDKRFNDYGHTLRELGLKKIFGDYVLLTNCDNYYIPKTVYYFNEALNEHTEQFDVVIFNMVHSHSSKKFLSYSPLSVEFRRNCIDVGAAFVKKEIAEMVGFRDKGFSGDATYFEDISKLKNHKIAICKINRILLVHN